MGTYEGNRPAHDGEDAGGHDDPLVEVLADPKGPLNNNVTELAPRFASDLVYIDFKTRLSPTGIEVRSARDGQFSSVVTGRCFLLPVLTDRRSPIPL